MHARRMHSLLRAITRLYPASPVSAKAWGCGLLLVGARAVVAQLRRACDTSIATLRSFENPIHGAAKESNLPSAGLPLPAGFEVLHLQGFCARLRGFMFV